MGLNGVVGATAADRELQYLHKTGSGKSVWAVLNHNSVFVVTALDHTTPPGLLPGDFDLGGTRTNSDIQVMLDALVNVEAYKTSHGLTDAQVLEVGDIDDNGAFANIDTQPTRRCSPVGDASTRVPRHAS